MRLLRGGCQVVHHLLPGVSQLHYMALQPIVKATCEEFGVKYNCQPSFYTAARSHINHLYALSLPPAIKAE
jgi:linoleoyl-CoA desaturase